MKKILCFTVILLFGMTLCACGEGDGKGGKTAGKRGRVVDAVYALSKEETEALTADMNKIARHGDICIEIGESPKTPEIYAEERFGTMFLDGTGILILVDTKRDDIVIKTGGACKGEYSDTVCRTIEDNGVRDLVNRRYYDCCKEILAEMREASPDGAGVSPNPSGILVNLLAALLCGFVLNVIALRLLSRKQLLSEKQKMETHKGSVIFHREYVDTKVDFDLSIFGSDGNGLF
ncbi:MAG: TPM domain-containing protein [Lachnospiraceae bacterium]|nr:TPM domain-containing protein [Lachnospiraceae bacterium]